jgi:hypothetical protein
MRPQDKTALKGLAVVVIVAAAAITLRPVYPNGYYAARKSYCLSNQKQLAIGISMYAAEHNGLLPLRDRWMDDAEPFIKNYPACARCPLLLEEEPPPQVYGYAFNSKLDQVNTDALKRPADEILLYDSMNLAKNASDPLLSLPVPARHGGYNCVVYVDAHARAIKPTQEQGPKP